MKLMKYSQIQQYTKLKKDGVQSFHLLKNLLKGIIIIFIIRLRNIEFSISSVEHNLFDSYPEVAQRQEVFWEAKRKHFREAMEVHNQIPQRQRRKSNRESIGSENEERNVGRGRKILRDSSMSDNDSVMESVKHKKTIRSRKVSETT